MTAIGLVGIENSHTTHFTRFLNVEQHHPGVRITAVVTGTPERTQELTELGDIHEQVGSPADLVGRIDAAIVSTRDGAKHLEHARPLLEAGVPVLIDKPLAASVADAQELIALAARYDAPLLSCSAVRHAPEVSSFTATQDTGALRHLHVTGPADPTDQHSGLFFYGIHLVEVALEILGNPDVGDDVTTPFVWRHDGELVIATSLVAGQAVTFTFLTPNDDRKAPFHATATYDKAVVSRDLTLGADYNAPALTEFVDLINGTAPARPESYLLSPVRVLASIVGALEG
jgi:predicted dehydrogenase